MLLVAIRETAILIDYLRACPRKRICLMVANSFIYCLYLLVLFIKVLRDYEF